MALKRCPGCGGLIKESTCRLCKIRNAEAVAAAKVYEPPPIIIRDLPPKWCQFCGAPFKRKKYAHGWEGYRQYARRRFCDRECSNKHKWHELVKRGVIKG